MADEFVHLHVHSEYSLLDGACRIKQLVKRGCDLNQKAIAVTDHGAMYAAIEFYNEARAQGIKPIIGCEVYVARRTRFDREHKLDSSPYHLVLLCENNEGYQNLIKLVSLGYTEGFYNRPRVDIELLKKYSKGLICLSACLAGEVAIKLTNNDYEAAKETALLYNGIFGQGNYYIEVQNHGLADQKRILPFLYKLSDETGIPLAATNDAHYIEREDSKLQQVLMCIQTGTTIDEPNAMSFGSDEFYIKSTEEMSELFRAEPTSISNTVKIAERCNVEFEFGVIKLPAFRTEGVTDNVEYFRRLCYDGLERHYGESPDEFIAERMKYELDIIIRMGYVDYFLIVWDFIRYAKDNGIPVGPGRGSGAGSLCAYCIGITGIDPIRYGLIFERFLNPERISMPDFDIDFCIEGRQRVIDYVIEKYGSDRVAQIVTFGTMAARAAIRDVGRALGVPYQVCDKTAKLIPNELNVTIEKALKKNKNLTELYDADTTVHELIDMAKKAEGMPRNTSTHAAGVVIASSAVSDFVPLKKNDDLIVTQYTMTVLESLGLLKMDFLGLRNLTVIRDCVRYVREKNKDFNIDGIPIDDKEVYAMLAEGKTSGVFQFESAGMRSVLMRLVPDSIEDMIAVISLYRPGPMESIPKYIENRHNPSKVTYKHPMLKKILDVTYGCIVYQEQVMEICREMAGYSYGRADLVRRAMSKKKHDVMEKERRNFIYGLKNEDGSVNCAGAVANGVSEAIANEIFDEMTSFASYAFNKSHAAAYAYLAYQTAYLRCHFFKEYMAALMTSVLMNTPKLMEYIAECESNGVRVIAPSINESFDGFTITDGGIRFGLLAIKNLGKGVIAGIVTERQKNGAFTSFRDFCKRMSGGDINKRAVESLIMAGALDNLGLNRRQMTENAGAIIDAYQSAESSKLEGQLDFFGGTSESTAYEMPIAYAEEYPVKELLRMEKEITGMYVSGNPIMQYALPARLMKITPCGRLAEESFKDNEPVSVLCSVAGLKMHTTKNGARMCFLTLEDMTGVAECVVFPKIYELYKSKLSDEEIIFVKGKISVKDEGCSILADAIFSENEFADGIRRKKLCVKLESNQMEKMNAIVAEAEGFKGENRLCFYMSDLNKTFGAKNKISVRVSNDLMNMLEKYVNLADIFLF